MQLVTEFIFGFLEFLNRLAKSARQFGKFLGAEKNENDQQNDDQIWAAEIHETGEKAHIQGEHSDPLAELARQFGTRPDREVLPALGVL